MKLVREETTKNSLVNTKATQDLTFLPKRIILWINETTPEAATKATRKAFRKTVGPIIDRRTSADSSVSRLDFNHSGKSFEPFAQGSQRFRLTIID